MLSSSHLVTTTILALLQKTVALNMQTTEKHVAAQLQLQNQEKKLEEKIEAVEQSLDIYG